MAAWCAARSTDEVLATLAEHGIPAGPVLSPRDALAHAQVQALGVLQSVDGPGLAAPAPVAGLPFTMSGESATAGAASGGVNTPPPASGQHTDEILAELGYSAAEITRLREQGTVA